MRSVSVDKALMPTRFQEPDLVVQLGKPPNRIDVLTRISGVEFEDAWPTRQEGVLDGIKVPIIGKAMLLQKQARLGAP